MVLSSATDQPLLGGFMILQLADHSHGVRAEHDLPVLCFIRLMLGRCYEAALQIDLRPPSRHDLVSPCSCEHQQLNETSKAKMNPPFFFLSSKFRKQAVDLVGRGIPAARFLGVVFYAMAGVLVSPPPALGQGEGLTQSLKAAVRRDGARVAAVPLPQCSLINIAKAPIRKRRAHDVQPEIYFIVLGTLDRLPRDRPALHISGEQVAQGFVCPSFAFLRPRVFTLHNRQPVTGGNDARLL